MYGEPNGRRIDLARPMRKRSTDRVRQKNSRGYIFFAAIALLLFAFIACMVVVSEEAEESDAASAGDVFTVDGLQYTINEGNTTVKLTQGKTGSVSIPDTVTYNNVTYTVTAIHDSSFSGLGVTSVTTGSHISYIGGNAFKKCTSLRSISIPSVGKIWQSAFEGCTSLSSVTISSNLTDIHRYAFKSCTTLSTFTWSGTKPVVNLYIQSFMNCTNLTDLNFTVNSFSSNSGDDTFAQSVFSGCSKLTTLDLAFTSLTVQNVKTTGTQSLVDRISGLTALTTLRAPNLTLDMSTESSLLNNYANLKVLDIKMSSIPENYFKTFSKLTTVSIGGATSIGNNAFESCPALTTFTATDATSVGSSAFKKCTALTTFTATKVTSIGGSAFEGCSALTTLSVSSGLSSIGNYCFKNCNKLSNFTTGSSHPSVSVGNQTFWYCTQLTSVPFYLSAVGESSFIGCTGLTSITLKGSVTSIGTKAFQNCTALQYVYRSGDESSSGLSIGNSAFEGCEILVNLNFSKISAVGGYSFKNCHKLASINLSQMTSNNVGSQAFWGCNVLSGSIILPSNVTTINSGAFNYCESITEVSLPGVTSIGDNAFNSCNKINKVTFSSSLSSLGSTPFSVTFKIDKTTKTAASDLKGYTWGKITGQESGTVLRKVTQLTYDNNGGTGTMTGRVIEMNVSYTLAANTFTKEGYAFMGWNTDTSSQVVSYNDKGSVTPTGSTLALKAVWYEKIPVPKGKNLTYTGELLEGIESSEKYSRSGHEETNAGSYSASITPTIGYAWENGTTTAKSVSWSISKAYASDWSIANIPDKVYTGSALTQTPSVSFNDDAVDASNYDLSYSNNTDVGTATLTFTAKSTSQNFTGTVSKTFKITPKPITITPTHAALTYGDDVPTSGYSYSITTGEMASGDTLSGTAVYTTTYTKMAAVGAYPINISGLSHSNYTITFAPGSMEVGKKSISVLTSSGTVTKVYDGTVAAGNYSGLSVSSADIMPGDSVVFTVTEVSAYDGTDVGQYTVTATVSMSGNDSDSYNLSVDTTTADAEITRKPITALSTDGAATKVYDGNVSAPVISGLTVTPTGKLDGDELSFTITSLSNYGSASVGEYTLIATITMDETGKYHNYYLATDKANATATITKKDVSVAVSGEVTKVYDGTTGIPNGYSNMLTLTPTGVVSGNKVTFSITNLTEYSSKAVGSEYTVTATIAMAGADAANYNLTTDEVSGVAAAITKATIVPSVSGTATKVYSATTDAPSTSTLTASGSGIFTGDDVTVSISSLTDYPNASVGSYKLIATVGISGVDSGNYVLSTNTVPNVSATVTKATITITPIVTSADVTPEDDDDTTIYLSEKVSLGFTAEGFAGEDTWASVMGSQVPMLDTAYTVLSPAGEYTAVANASSLTSANYTFQTVDKEFTVQNDYRVGHVFQVELVLNGGTFATTVTSYKYKTGTSLPRTPTSAPKGYKTAENTVDWYDNVGLSGDPVNSISDTDSGDKKLYAKYTLEDYTITAAAEVTGATVSADANTKNYEQTVTITVTLSPGYGLSSLTYTPEDESPVSLKIDDPRATSYTFKMPDKNITLAYTCVASEYSVSISPVEGVTITASDPPWATDSTVILTVTVADGYNATNLKYNDGTDDHIISASVETGSYEFTMPAHNAVVSCTCTPIDYTVTVTQTAGATVEASKVSQVHVGEMITLTASAFATGKEIGEFSGTDVTKVNDTTFTFVMPADNVTLTYTVTDIPYSVSVTPTTGATLSGPATATYNSTVTLNVTGLGIGYELKTLKVNGNNVEMTDGSAASQTFTMPAQNSIITYTVGLIEYDVEVTTVTGATVSSSNAKATMGSQVTLTITPSLGYKVDSITYNGITVQNPGSKLTFTMPAAKISVTYVCSKIPYAISMPSPLPTGVSSISATVDSASVVTARYGDSVSISVTPSEGYQVTSLKWNGFSATYVSPTEYTFTMPAEEVTISVTMEKVNYPVTVTQIPGNTVSSNVTTAQIGDVVTLNVALQTGHQLATLVYNDGSDHPIQVVDPLATAYSFTMPAAAVAVSYTIAKCDYEISMPSPLPTGVSSISASVGGDVTPTANYRDAVTLNVVLQTGYRLTSIEYNGQSIDVTTKTFTMPASNVSINCTVAKIDYDITITTATGATVVASKAPANYSDAVTLTIHLDTGYQLDSISASYSGGQIGLSGSGNTRQFTMPADDVTVTYAASKIQYAVVLPTDVTGLGSMTASKTSAYYNDEITLNITPAKGYKLDSVSVNGVDIPINGAIRFAMPDATATISCSFSKLTYAVKVIASSNATVIAAPTSATYEDTINLTTTLPTGYHITSISATDSSSQDVPLTATGTGYKFSMPASDVTIVYTSGKIDYPITVSTGGYITAQTTANYNETVVISKNLPAGYQLDWVKYSYGQSEYTVNLGVMSFSMPDSAVTVTYQVSKIVYDVAVVSNNGATVVASKSKAVIDDPITVTISPDTGYRLDSISASYSGGQVDLSGSDNIRQFDMPAGSVTISYEAVKIDFDLVLGTHTGASATAIVEGVSKSLDTVANYGDKIEIVATAESGYRVDSVSYSYNNATYAAERTQSGNYSFTMPLYAVSVSLNCSKIPFNVTVDNSPIGASVKIAQSSSYYDSVSNKYLGDIITLSVTPDLGYQLDRLYYNGVLVTDMVGYTFSMPAANVIVTYECSKIMYNINLADLTTGVTSISVSNKAGYGDSVPVSIGLENDYNISSLYYYKGTDQNVKYNLTMTSASSASFNMPLSDITIVCEAAQNLHSITILGVEGLSITTDKASTTQGTTVTITVAPNAGYSLSTISAFYFAPSGDDTPVKQTVGLNGSGNTRTFTMVTYDVTIDATSSLIDYTITKPGATTGVSAVNVTVDGQTPDTLKAHINQSITVAVTAATGYAIDWLKINGGDALVPSNVDINERIYEYTFAMPATAVNITCGASKIPYEISIVNTTGATFSSNVQSASYNDEVTLTVGFAVGYKLSTLKYNDTPISVSATGLETSYTFHMPDQDVSITYTCEMIKYPLTIFKSDHATVTASKMEDLTYQESVTLTVVLDTGYQLNALAYNDTAITITDHLATSYQFTMPASAVTISYECGKIDYTVSKASNPEGIALELNMDSANYMEKVTVTATVQPGYKLESLQYTNGIDTWSVDISSNATSAYSFNMPAYNVTVSATSSKVERTITVDTETGATVNLSKSSGIYVGDSISFTVSLLTGYSLKSLEITYNDGAVTPPQLPYDVEGSTYTFTMPGYDTKVTVRAEQTPYDVSVTAIAGATITVKDSAGETKNTGWHYGDTVRLIVEMTPGYKLNSMSFGNTSVALSSPVAADPLEYRVVMPNNNVILSYECSYIYYDVSVTKVEGAGVIPSQQTAHVGERILLNVNADTGYELSSVTVTSGESPVTVTKISETVYRFDMPAGHAVIEYTVAKIDYGISIPGPLPTGIDSISAQVQGSPTVKANYRDAVMLIVTPSTGYQVNWVRFNGTPAIATATGFSFTMPATDVEVSASASLIEYDVTIYSEKGGTLSSPSTATYGSTVYLTLSLDTGYELPSPPVITYGESHLSATMDNDTTYHFLMPASDVSCTYEPVKIDYDITVPDTVPGGTLSVQSVDTRTTDLDKGNYGDLVVLSVTPNEGYRVDWVMYNDTLIQPNRGSAAYSFTMPAAKASVTCAFTFIDYPIVLVFPAGITMAAEPSLAHIGDTVTIDVSMAEGYSFAGISAKDSGDNTVDVTTVEEISIYTLVMPASSVTVTVTATALEYTVSFESNGGTDVPAQIVRHGETVTQPSEPTKEPTSKIRYSFDGWFSDENLEEPYDFATPVTEVMTLYAKWTETEIPQPTPPGPSPGPQPVPPTPVPPQPVPISYIDDEGNLHEITEKEVEGWEVNIEKITKVDNTQTTIATVTVGDMESRAIINVDEQGAVTAEMSSTIKTGSSSSVSADQIADAVSASRAAAEAIDAEVYVMDVIIDATTSSGTSTMTSINMDLSSIDECGIVVMGDAGSVSFDSTSVGSMKEKSNEISIVIGHATDDVTTPAQKAAANGLQIYDVSATAGSEKIKTFAGAVTLTLPYELAYGEDPSLVAIYYISDNATVEKVGGQYADGFVSGELSHLSLYFAWNGQSEEETSESNIGLMVAITIIAAIVIVGAAFYIRKHN